MRAQFFYITGINALEDAAGYFYSERDKSDTKSNQIASLAPTSSPRLPHASIAFIADSQGRCRENPLRAGGRCRTLADVFRFAVSALCAPCRAALTAASAPLSSALPSSALPSAALLSSALPSSALLSSAGVLAHDGTRR
jgi:hypothetical protein